MAEVFAQQQINDEKSKKLSQCQQLTQENLIPKNVTPQRKWTKEEDYKLIELVLNFQDWDEIVKHFPGRSEVQCYRHWNCVIKPSLVNVPWTKEEDEFIIKFVRMHGERWRLISRELKLRSENQCRERWYKYLRDFHSKEANQQIIEAVNSEGKENSLHPLNTSHDKTTSFNLTHDSNHSSDSSPFESKESRMNQITTANINPSTSQKKHSTTDLSEATPVAIFFVDDLSAIKTMVDKLDDFWNLNTGITEEDDDLPIFVML